MPFAPGKTSSVEVSNVPTYSPGVPGAWNPAAAWTDRMAAYGRALFMAMAMALALVSCHAPIRPPEQTAPDTLRPTAVVKTEVRNAEAQPKPEARPAPSPPPPDVFGRLRATLGDDHCESTPQQARWIQLYAPRPERFGERIAHMLPLFDYVLSEIEAAGLPGEFALIPIIESTYRPQARSPQGPAGMWQFTADTARNFGLEVSRDHDERLSVVDATSAALKFLGELHAQHGDWALAAAGYNAGPYRLSKLLEVAERAPEPGEIPSGMPRTTHEYIAKLKAWACMLSEPDRLGIALPDAESFEPLARVSAPRQLQRLELISDVSGLDREVLRALNPLLRTSPPARGERQLLLPEDAAAELLGFMQRVQRGEIPLPEPRLHTVVAGDTLSAIARRHGLRIRDIQAWNALAPNAVLRIGQALRLDAPVIAPK